MGGLGNQLFQIFATISYSIMSHNEFKFLNVKQLGEHDKNITVRYTYWDSFLYNLKPFLLEKLPSIEVIKEQGFYYKPLPTHLMNKYNIMIHGYFQSYKYFEKYYETICKIIKLDEQKNSLLFKLNYDYDFLKNTISIHFRMGDYKKYQNFHPIMNTQYYIDALNHIKQSNKEMQYTVFYFCEDEDIIEINKRIDLLKSKFPEYTFIRGGENLEDWEQMLLMSFCHHNVIANSSFSWWSAYFNNWNDKIVCYPSKWFCNNKIITKDLYPPEWIRIIAQ